MDLGLHPGLRLLRLDKLLELFLHTMDVARRRSARCVNRPARRRSRTWEAASSLSPAVSAMSCANGTEDYGESEAGARWWKLQAAAARVRTPVIRSWQCVWHVA